MLIKKARREKLPELGCSIYLAYSGQCLPEMVLSLEIKGIKKHSSLKNLFSLQTGQTHWPFQLAFFKKKVAPKTILEIVPKEYVSGFTFATNRIQPTRRNDRKQSKKNQE